MIEVEVENFQSVEKVQFKIDGFTALVGRSNIGKSAVTRAIRNALTGASGTDFVRHGPSCERRLKDNKRCKCQTKVSIRTPKLTLVWEKGDSVNRYTVTRLGEPPILFDKVERGTPDFLKPEFTPVKVGEDRQLIQVTEQFQPIFLLNESGSVVADVLSDVARLDDINEAMRLVVKDRKEASATRIVREKDVTELRQGLTAYVGLDNAAERIRALEKQHEVIQRTQRQCDQAKQFLVKWEGLANTLRCLRDATAVELPEVASLEKASRDYFTLVRFHEDLISRAPVVRQLAGVEKVALPEKEPLERALGDLTQIEGWRTRLHALKEKYDQGRTVAATTDPNAEAMASGLRQLCGVHDFLQRDQATAKSIQSLEEQMQAAEKEEAAALEGLQALGICPTCSQRIGSDQHLHLEAAS